MAEGWIKLHRKMMSWEWYTDANTFRLMLHCILKANHQYQKWRGIDIERGSFVTSYPKLCAELNISLQSMRTSLKRLKSTGELTVSKTSKYSMISVTNYDQYQETNSLANTQITDKQQATNSQVTTNKNDKKEKKEKNDKKTHCAFGDDFAQFWEAYPIKKDKQRAHNAWLQIKPNEQLTKKILNSLENQKGEKLLLQSRNEFTPIWKNPATWLNGECWEDELSEQALKLNHDNQAIEDWINGTDQNFIEGDFYAK